MPLVDAVIPVAHNEKESSDVNTVSLLGTITGDAGLIVAT